MELNENITYLKATFNEARDPAAAQPETGRVLVPPLPSGGFLVYGSTGRRSGDCLKGLGMVPPTGVGVKVVLGQCNCFFKVAAA